MENGAIPVASIGANTKPVTRSIWKRRLVELNGKPGRNYIHDVSPLLLQSYAEIGEFPHEHNIWEPPCATQTRLDDSSNMLQWLYSGSAPDFRQPQSRVAFHLLQMSVFKAGVSALEFDTKGTCLASVTRSGCLTVHEFGSLHSHGNESDPGQDERKPLRHFALSEGPSHARINAFRWNPSSQDEIAYTSRRNTEVSIFDSGYNSSQPTEVLRRHAVGIYANQYISDLAFLNCGARVLASDSCGVISMWDRRVSDLPQIRLTTSQINSAPSCLSRIQLHGDQYVYGACKSGFIHIWDLRGGRSLAAFQSDKEVYSSPLTSINLASMLNNNGPLQGIQSININPSCPYQLGFHLGDGRSGVLDMHNFQVSHIHCPFPSSWLDGPNAAIYESPPRKPAWLPNHSIYVAPSLSSNGLHLLDFYPHSSSPCRVDNDDSKSMGSSTVEHKQSVFVPLSKRVIACAVHPLDDTIVAGTLDASLLVISQKHLCMKGDDDDDEHETVYGVKNNKDV